MKKNNPLLSNAKKCFLLCILYISPCVNFFSEETQGFVLMTTLYNELNIDRQNEFLTCFYKNSSLPSIEKIVILYEGSDTDSILKLLSYINQKNLKASIVYINKRPCFNDFFEIANSEYPGRKIIICNADIYFDESLDQIENSHLDNTLLCLSRWTKTQDGKLYIPLVYNHDYSLSRKLIWSKKLSSGYFLASHDSWIFLAPIRKFHSEILIGVMGCETIGYHAYQAGMHVCNPALSVLSYHQHESEIRTYDPTKIIYRPPYLNLRLCHLSNKPFPPCFSYR